MDPLPPSPADGAPAAEVPGQPPIRLLRVATGAVVFAAAIGLLVCDHVTGRPYAFIVLTVVLGAAALHEYIAMCPREIVWRFRRRAVFACAVVLVASWADAVGSREASSFGREAALTGGFFLLVARAARMDLTPETLKGLALAFLGVFLVGWLVGFLIRIRLCDEGETACWMIIGCAKGGDCAAYFAGSLFGRHRLAPRVSPKKTWEGAAGCVLGGLLFAVPYAFLWKGWGTAHPRDVFLLGAIIGAAAQAGDLAESFLKRCLGAKDSGGLLGEAGGILDMVDSLLVAAPAAYLYLALTQTRWSWYAGGGIP